MAIVEHEQHDQVSCHARLPWRLARECRALLGQGAVQHSIAAVSDQAIVSAKGFLTGVIVARACSKEEFGLFALAVSCVSLAISLQTSIVGVPYMVYHGRLTGSAQHEYTDSALLHSLLLSSLVAVILGSFSLLLPRLGYGNGIPAVALPLAGAMSFIMLQDCVRQVTLAKLQTRLVLVIDALVTALQLIVLWAFARRAGLSIAVVYAVVAGASCAGVVAWAASGRDHSRLRVTGFVEHLRHNWRMGKWVLGSTVFWSISVDCYPWLLAAWFGTRTTAVWAACVGISALGNPLLQGIANFLGPRMAQVYSQDGVVALRRFTRRAILAYLAGAAPVAAVLVTAGGTLVPMVYGEQYAGYGLLVAALAVSLLVDAVRFALSRALFTVERADLVLKCNGGSFVALLPVTVLLVSQYGPLGAALGLLANNAIAAVLMAFIFLRVMTSLARSGAP